MWIRVLVGALAATAVLAAGAAPAPTPSSATPSASPTRSGGVRPRREARHPGNDHGGGRLDVDRHRRCEPPLHRDGPADGVRHPQGPGDRPGVPGRCSGPDRRHGQRVGGHGHPGRGGRRGREAGAGTERAARHPGRRHGVTAPAAPGRVGLRRAGHRPFPCRRGSARRRPPPWSDGSRPRSPRPVAPSAEFLLNRRSSRRRSSSSAEVCTMSTSHTAFFTTSRGTDPEQLPLARAQPAVADDDEVRRVRADRVEKGLRRVPADEPLLDVSRPLLGETGDRLLQGLAGGLDPVEVAVHPLGGRRSRARVALAVRRDDDQPGLGGLRHLRGPVHGVQAGRGAVRTDDDPVVHGDAARGCRAARSATRPPRRAGSPTASPRRRWPSGRRRGSSRWCPCCRAGG